MNELPIANEMPYWKSGTSSPDSWFDKVENLIEKYGGTIHSRVVARSGHNEGIMIGFTIAGESFKLTWPVLPPKNPNDRLAATRQAATMIYHDTKARVNRLAIFDPKVVFADWLLLENGRTIAENPNTNIAQHLSGMIGQG